MPEREVLSDPLSSVLAQSIDVTEGCWLWTGALDHAGYGLCPKTAGERRAHRATYALINGPIPEGHHIHHKCHVRRCVRPDHLEPIRPTKDGTDG